MEQSHRNPSLIAAINMDPVTLLNHYDVTRVQKIISNYTRKVILNCACSINKGNNVLPYLYILLIATLDAHLLII